MSIIKVEEIEIEEKNPDQLNEDILALSNSIQKEQKFLRKMMFVFTVVEIASLITIGIQAVSSDWVMVGIMTIVYLANRKLGTKWILQQTALIEGIAADIEYSYIQLTKASFKFASANLQKVSAAFREKGGE